MFGRMSGKCAFIIPSELGFSVQLIHGRPIAIVAVSLIASCLYSLRCFNSSLPYIYSHFMFLMKFIEISLEVVCRFSANCPGFQWPNDMFYCVV